MYAVPPLDARADVTNPAGRYYVPPDQVAGIAIHHSVSFWPAANQTEADERAHIRMIDAYHVSLDYGGFGYHLAAFPSGRWYLCGELTGARAHVANHNTELRGIVLIGTFATVPPGGPQLTAGRLAVDYVRTNLVRPFLPVKGHRDWADPDWATSCPGDALAALLPDLMLKGADDVTPEEHNWLKATLDIVTALHVRVLGEDAFADVKRAIRAILEEELGDALDQEYYDLIGVRIAQVLDARGRAAAGVVDYPPQAVTQ